MKKFIAIVLSLVMVFAFAACATQAPEQKAADTTKAAAPAGDLKFDFTVKDIEGNEQTTAIAFNEGDTVADALVAAGIVEYSEDGLYNTVSGITYDWNETQTYWALYIGEDMASEGINTIKAEAGASYSFIATK